MQKSIYGSICARALAISLLATVGPARGEWYVAGQVGVNFADRLTNVEGTGSLVTLRAPDFDLKNAVAYGGKLGYFPANGAMGLELDVLNSQPNIKNLD